MEKQPADVVDQDWVRYAADPEEVDANRKDAYLSYEAFLRAKLTELDKKRPSLWDRDYSSLEAYERSVAPMRTRLKDMLGFWEEPGDRAPLIVRGRKLIAEGDFFTAHRFRIEVAPGLETYGITLAPKSEGPHPGLIAQHGYSGTPEMVCGLAASSVTSEDYGYRAAGLRAVKRGFYVVAINHPTSYGATSDECAAPLPGFENYPRTYGKNRLHRLAVLAGGTLFGLDMLGTSRGVDLLCSLPEVNSERVGMYGLSQGGMSALYQPALDTRIKASVCSAYFNTRFVKMIGPGHRGMTFLDAQEEDKFFSGLLRWFSDSDIASLIAPRAFAVEAGEKDSSIDYEWSAKEFPLAKAHYERLGIPDRCEFIGHEFGHVSTTSRALDFLQEMLG